jgi:hypothetical protein
MENVDDIINELVEDLDIQDDVPVAYEVWATAYDEDGTVDASEMYITAFTDPDEAVAYAKWLTAASILTFAEESPVCSDAYADIEGVIIEVETTVIDENNDSVNIGTVYRNKLELFEAIPEFVVLSNDDYSIIEETSYIVVTCDLPREYKVGETITLLFEEDEHPWPIKYKIIRKSADGYICDFV